MLRTQSDNWKNARIKLVNSLDEQERTYTSETGNEEKIERIEKKTSLDLNGGGERAAGNVSCVKRAVVFCRKVYRNNETE